jgi:hypothetical protein
MGSAFDSHSAFLAHVRRCTAIRRVTYRTAINPTSSCISGVGMDRVVGVESLLSDDEYARVTASLGLRVSGKCCELDIV